MGKTSIVGLFLILAALTVVNPTAAQSGWTREVSAGLTGAENEYVGAMAVSNGSLYAGTNNGNDGAELWERGYSPPFLVWTQSNIDGFGDPNNTTIMSMAEFSNPSPALYVGTYSDSGCEIWFDGTGLGWTQYHGSGLGDPNNLAAPSMAAFGNFAGSLYVGTYNPSGLQIHRLISNGGWSTVVSGGFGDAHNNEAEAMSVGGGFLYVSTYNSINGPDIWNTADGTNWDVYWQGGPPNSTTCDAILATDGIVIAAYDGPNGVRIYSVGPMIVNQLNQDGFGDADNTATTSITEFHGKVYVATENVVAGGGVWRMDGVDNWTQVNQDGFGDAHNTSVTALTVLGDSLFAGTSNFYDGAEVWRYDALIFGDGFESGEVSWWGP